MTRIATIVVAVLALAVSAWAQTTPIVRFDCGIDGSAFPNCGASGSNGSQMGVAWRRAMTLDTGPGGIDGVQIDHIGVTDTALEYYHGAWNWTSGLGAAVPQGGCRVIREKIQFLAPVDWLDNANGRFGFKHILMGTDGTFDTSRLIINFRSPTTGGGSPVLLRVEKNVDGPPSRIDIPGFTSTGGPQGNGFYSIQYEACSSSTPTATDATIKVWVNSNNYSTPTAQSTGFSWVPNNWHSRVTLGYYGESLGVGHNASYRIYAFEYDDEFDPGWYSTGGPTPTPPPAPTTPALASIR